MQMYTDETGRVHVTVNICGEKGSFSFVPFETTLRKIDDEYGAPLGPGEYYCWIEPDETK